MGLGPVTNTQTNSPNFIDSLYDAHKAKNRNFSLCLGTNGGYLTFGGYNVKKHIKGEPVQTVKFSGSYAVNFGAIGVNRSLPQPNGKGETPYAGLLDSGTTYTYFTKEIFMQLRSDFGEFCGKPAAGGRPACGGKPKLDNTYCVVYDPSVYGNLETFYGTFPKFYFNLDNSAEIVWFPKDYLFTNSELSNSNIEFCSSINMEDQETTRNQFSTFGSLFLRHYDIYFDRKKSEVSFVRSECEDRNLSSYPVQGIRTLIQKFRVFISAVLGASDDSFIIGLTMVGLSGLVLSL
jgi:hypothetical protein